MSLLLQALQKAAKSREEGASELFSDGPADDELALEPIQAEPALREEAPAAPSPAQAATVMQASRAPAFDPLDYMREHYMLTFIGVALLFAIGYGTYVYIQVARPAIFRSSPPSPPAPAPLAAAAPAANGQPAPTAKITGLPGTDTVPAVAGQTAPMVAPAPSVFDEPAAAPETGVTAEEPVRRATSRPRRQAEPRPEQPVETVMIQPAQPSDIAVRRAPATVTPIDPLLLQAYEALQGGDTAGARPLYAEVLRSDSRSIDALLGLGAIAWKEGRVEEASQHYQRVLELDPRNAFAQAGLISIIGSADPQSSESRLKQLIARDPSAFLHFTLGNLYAEQGQWSAAQQSYFQAYQLQSDNADYAFNLAVGLEHLGQVRLALDYYRKALDLSFRKGRANFDQNLVIQRVGQLSSRVE